MINIQENIALAPYTTFKIGGPARYFVVAKNEEMVQEALVWAQKNNQPVFVMGGGSNVLISDDGYKGLVLYLEHVDPEIDLEEKQIHCFSGCLLSRIIDTAVKNSLSGMENMAGIPGTAGGAVRGNAGAFGVEAKDVVVSVRAIDRETGKIHEFRRNKCEFSYRNSLFKKEKIWIVVGVVFQLGEGNKEGLLEIVEEIKGKRNEKQDQEVCCAGSFFVNPVVENENLRKEFEEEAQTKSRGNKVPAGWLIDRVEMRGKQIGGAMVSEQHPNYIVNTGNATAKDVIMLVSIVKRAVRDTYNVELQREVQYIGFD